MRLCEFTSRRRNHSYNFLCLPDSLICSKEPPHCCRVCYLLPCHTCLLFYNIRRINQKENSPLSAPLNTIWRIFFNSFATVRHLKFRSSFICQGTLTRRQRNDLFGLPVKLPPVTTSLTTCYYLIWLAPTIQLCIVFRLSAVQEQMV